ncbi:MULTISPECIES: helix-turn-helix domain-containing protein [unclassified Arthrobacter]|uniref:helix-turn-helix domain-containing protein n=1 Tax=Arthrobacter sp. AET 35A TaxID=2292643 RepID=UPI001491A039|nr:DNA-binding protein [Arthrobacter sp. AET 35A]NOJ63368.1 helix-turn-helix domain-containing protein [Arthrobacter sp. 147(2020)]
MTSPSANLTAADIAERLNVDVDTVRRMCRSGKWPSTRIGRLYRFTEDQYLSIIAPPPVPEPASQRQRTEQRKNIGRLFRNL